MEKKSQNTFFFFTYMFCFLFFLERKLYIQRRAPRPLPRRQACEERPRGRGRLRSMATLWWVWSGLVNRWGLRVRYLYEEPHRGEKNNQGRPNFVWVTKCKITSCGTCEKSFRMFGHLQACVYSAILIRERLCNLCCAKHGCETMVIDTLDWDHKSFSALFTAGMGKLRHGPLNFKKLD